MDHALHDFNRSKAKLVDDFKTIINDAEALLQATAHIPGESFAAERAKLNERLKHAKSHLEDAEQRILGTAKEAVATTDHYVHANPWTAVGVAAAVGMLIGFLAAKR